MAADRIGVRATLASGLTVIGVMVAFAARAETLPGLLGCHAIAGFGFSVLNPATGKAVLDWFPPRQRGIAMGIKQTGLTLGGVAGALTLPPLAVGADWRHAITAAGLTSLACALLVAIAYRSSGHVSVATTVDPGRFREALGFLRRPGVVVVMTCGLALSMAQSSLLAYLALYGREVLDRSAVEAGRLLALAQIGGAAGRFAWGFISDRAFQSRRRTRHRRQRVPRRRELRAALGGRPFAERGRAAHRACGGDRGLSAGSGCT
jgi:sugar phosphate permease